MCLGCLVEVKVGVEKGLWTACIVKEEQQDRLVFMDAFTTPHSQVPLSFKFLNHCYLDSRKPLCQAVNHLEAAIRSWGTMLAATFQTSGLQ